MRNNGSAKIVVILLALAVVLGVGYVVVDKKKVDVPGQIQDRPIKRLTETAILNGEYFVADAKDVVSPTGIVPFVNGEYTIPSDLVMGERGWVTRIQVFPQAVFDFDKDGNEDAVVGFRSKSGGSGSWTHLGAVTVREDGVVVDKNFEFPGINSSVDFFDRDVVEDIIVEGDFVTIKAVVHDNDDSLATPTVQKTIKLRFENNKFVEI